MDDLTLMSTSKDQVKCLVPADYALVQDLECGASSGLQSYESEMAGLAGALETRECLEHVFHGGTDILTWPLLLQRMIH